MSTRTVLAPEELGQSTPVTVEAIGALKEPAGDT